MRTQPVHTLVVLASVVTLSAGCRPSADDAKSAPPLADTSSAPPASAPTPAAPVLTGSFDAVSTTAMGITGDLELTQSSLTFSKELVYETQIVASVGSAEDYAKGAGPWADLLGVGSDASVELRRVVSEKVGAQAPNGGLCAPDGTAFIALAATAGASNLPTLRMAAFKGPSPPGPDGNDTDLCGTFNYAPRGEHEDHEGHEDFF